MIEPANLPTYEDVEAAAHRIAGAIQRTPLLRSDVLDEALGARCFVKAECLQRGGAFKIRGAYNKIASLDPDVRARGVLAFSSGNHAIAVATAARDFGIAATIVMPSDAPRAKRETTASLGAKIVAYDRVSEDREAIGGAIAQAQGLTIVRPFDDSLVIAGQGTIGLEIKDDLAARGLAPDLVIANGGGGGLGTGIALALSRVAENARVVVAEPEGHDEFARSLAAGERLRNAPGVRSICDALLSEQPGVITFALAQKLGLAAVSVSDEAVLRAMAFAFRRLKIVVEPGGAAALAAGLSGKLDLNGKTIVFIASGGNVDADVFARALSYA